MKKILKKIILIALVIMPNICIAQTDPDIRRAMNVTGKILYSKLHIKQKINHLKDKYIPKSVQKYGGWIFIIQKDLRQKQINYTWTYKF